jgi:hypothetical protein
MTSMFSYYKNLVYDNWFYLTKFKQKNFNFQKDMNYYKGRKVRHICILRIIIVDMRSILHGFLFYFSADMCASDEKCI